MAVKEVLFAAGAAGGALLIGADTRPAEIVGEGTMTVRDDGGYATYGNHIDCFGAVMEITVEQNTSGEAASSGDETSEEVMPDADCYPEDSPVPDTNHTRAEALEVLGYPADVQAYATENGASTTKPPEDETIMNELLDARHNRASTRARWLGGLTLTLAAAGLVVRRRFGGGGGHGDGGHGGGHH